MVARRSDRVGVGEGEWNSSANEGLHREFDSPGGEAPQLFRAAERGLAEELQLRPDQYDLKLLPFAVVTENSQWCCFFLATLGRMTRRQFEQNVGRGVQDAFEHRGFDFVEFEPASTIPYLLRPDRRDAWAPAAPVLFYLSLVHVHGRWATDQVIEELEREGSRSSVRKVSRCPDRTGGSVCTTSLSTSSGGPPRPSCSPGTPRELPG